MIDAKDIRAGNQVFFKNSGSTVTVLEVDSDKVLLDTFPKSSYFSNGDISGIPLTTSILQKLSFKNDDDINTWFGQGVSIHVKPDGFFYGLRILKSRAKIQHLHELQNYVSDFYSVFKEQIRSLDLNPL